MLPGSRSILSGFQRGSASADFCVCKERCQNRLLGKALMDLIERTSHGEAKPPIWRKSEDASAVPT